MATAALGIAADGLMCTDMLGSIFQGPPALSAADAAQNAGSVVLGQVKQANSQIKLMTNDNLDNAELILENYKLKHDQIDDAIQAKLDAGVDAARYKAAKKGLAKLKKQWGITAGAQADEYRYEAFLKTFRDQAEQNREHWITNHKNLLALTKKMQDDNYTEKERHYLEMIEKIQTDTETTMENEQENARKDIELQVKGMDEEIADKTDRINAFKTAMEHAQKARKYAWKMNTEQRQQHDKLVKLKRKGSDQRLDTIVEQTNLDRANMEANNQSLLSLLKDQITSKGAMRKKRRENEEESFNTAMGIFEGSLDLGLNPMKQSHDLEIERYQNRIKDLTDYDEEVRRDQKEAIKKNEDRRQQWIAQQKADEERRRKDEEKQRAIQQQREEEDRHQRYYLQNIRANSYGQNNYGQNSYGRNSSGRGSYRRGGYGRGGYGNDNYGRDDYGHDNYGRDDGYGQNNYGRNSYGQNSSGRGSYRRGSSGRGGYGQDNYGPDGYGRDDGYGQDNYGHDDDYGQDNYGPDGYGQDNDGHRSSSRGNDQFQKPYRQPIPTNDIGNDEFEHPPREKPNQYDQKPSSNLSPKQQQSSIPSSQSIHPNQYDQKPSPNLSPKQQQSSIPSSQSIHPELPTKPQKLVLPKPDPSLKFEPKTKDPSPIQNFLSETDVNEKIESPKWLEEPLRPTVAINDDRQYDNDDRQYDDYDQQYDNDYSDESGDDDWQESQDLGDDVEDWGVRRLRAREYDHNGGMYSVTGLLINLIALILF